MCEFHWKINSLFVFQKKRFCPVRTVQPMRSETGSWCKRICSSICAARCSQSTSMLLWSSETYTGFKITSPKHHLDVSVKPPKCWLSVWAEVMLSGFKQTRPHCLSAAQPPAALDTCSGHCQWWRRPLGRWWSGTKGWVCPRTFYCWEGKGLWQGSGLFEDKTPSVVVWGRTLSRCSWCPWRWKTWTPENPLSSSPQTSPHLCEDNDTQITLTTSSVSNGWVDTCQKLLRLKYL